MIHEWAIPNDSIQVVVLGSPAPQGSKTPVGRARNGRVLMRESSKYLKPWRKRVTARVNELFDQEGIDRAVDLPLLGVQAPVVIERMVFTMPRAAKPAPHLMDVPAKKPDWDKLARAICDAFTDARVWQDDEYIVRAGEVEKVYPAQYSGHQWALPEPGVVVLARRK